jgi:hypothetical protein
VVDALDHTHRAARIAGERCQPLLGFTVCSALAGTASVRSTHAVLPKAWPRDHCGMLFLVSAFGSAFPMALGVAVGQCFGFHLLS